MTGAAASTRAASTRVATTRAASTRAARTWAGRAAGVGVLGVLVWHAGSGPFVAGLGSVSLAAALAAVGTGVLTTTCCAWRWVLVARSFGVPLSLGPAVAACYRAQFLNSVLPGGVAGDAERAVRHGRDIDDVGLAVQAVVLERGLGLVVTVLLAVPVLCLSPSPVQPFLPRVGAALAVVGLAAAALVVVLRSVPSAPGRSRALRHGRAVAGRVRSRLGTVRASGRTWLGLVLTTAAVLGGHLAIFLVAARAVGVTAPLALLAPLTLVSLLAMVVPIGVAGWGPREGVAAWVFGAAGLTAVDGLTTAVAFGVLGFLASLPGAVVLLGRRPGWRPARA